MWGSHNNAKLVELFRTPHNKVDPNKLDIDAVKAVHAKYFPQFKYRNFAPLYRAKARSWNVSKTLDGHRKSEFTLFVNCLLLVLPIFANNFFFKDLLLQKAKLLPRKPQPIVTLILLFIQMAVILSQRKKKILN